MDASLCNHCECFASCIYSFKTQKKRSKRKVISKITIPQAVPQIALNQLNLFGTFQIKIKGQGNITNKFSPLLRQILSFFILNNIENKDGITIKKLSDTFWPGASKDKAKENRSTNLKKLRRLLEEIDGISIQYKEKKWHLVIDDNISIDVFRYNKLKSIILKEAENNKIEPALIAELLEIIKPGNILQNLETEWLDAYKSSISADVIDLLFALLKLEINHELKIEIARTVLKFDHLNEEALKCILTGYNSLGNHGQAQQFYDDFCKKYLHLYNEEYPVAFKEIIKN